MARKKETPKTKNTKRPSSEDEGSEQSSSSSLDFLGRAPSHSPSERDATSTEASSTRSSQSPPPSPEQPPRNTSNRRKQPKPKKRKDRALQELIKLQSTTKLLIPRLPFQRLVREVLQQFQQDFRMQTATLECLQEASESYLVGLFEDSYLCCMHRQRVTLNEKDMRLVQIIRGQTDLGKK